jgi:hypothetical protein
MRKRHAQILLGETDEDVGDRHESSAEDQQSSVDIPVAEFEEPWTMSAESDASENSRPRRAKIAPRWLQDYEVDFSA